MPGFVLLSDTHIVAPGALAYGRSDTAAALSATVASINARLPMLRGIDCAIVTGDLTDHGRPEEYAHFAKLLDKLALPWRAIPGNHDRRGPMRACFGGADWMPDAGPVHWLRDFGPFAVIGLDTLDEGAHHGALSPEGVAFLDQALTGLGAKPVVIATHHPWMHVGIPAMDADNLRNGAALMARLARHRGPVRMVSGHVHRAATAQIGRVTCQVVPATCHAVVTDHRAGQAPQLALEPGGFTLCHWVEAPVPGLVTDTIASGVFAGPWPFDD